MDVNQEYQDWMKAQEFAKAEDFEGITPQEVAAMVDNLRRYAFGLQSQVTTMAEQIKQIEIRLAE